MTGEDFLESDTTSGSSDASGFNDDDRADDVAGGSAARDDACSIGDSEDSASKIGSLLDDILAATSEGRTDGWCGGA